MFPRIIGMACTDQSGRLYFEKEAKKRLIARHPGVPDWVAPMDFSLLKRFLEKHWQYGTLVIIGANTYQDSERLMRSHQAKNRSSIMISHPDHYRLMPSGGERFNYPVSDSLAGLRIAARQICLDKDYKQILVMGGRSVYQAFAGHYDHFTHCQVFTNEMYQSSGGGAIKISEILETENYLRDRPVNASAFEQPKYCVSTPLVEDGYRVTQYDRMQ